MSDRGSGGETLFYEWDGPAALSTLPRRTGVSGSSGFRRDGADAPRWFSLPRRRASEREKCQPAGLCGRHHEVPELTTPASVHWRSQRSAAPLCLALVGWSSLIFQAGRLDRQRASGIVLQPEQASRTTRGAQKANRPCWRMQAPERMDDTIGPGVRDRGLVPWEPRRQPPRLW
jgi:hypothetical protein